MAHQVCRRSERYRHKLSGSNFGPVVYWLGRQPFKLEKGDRTPLGLPRFCCGVRTDTSIGAQRRNEKEPFRLFPAMRD
jgi:hypothetical protein